MMDYEAIGRRIRQARIKNGLSQEETAELAHISLSFYGHIERGTRKMSMETFAAICSALNCSADFILGNSAAYPVAYRQTLQRLQDFIASE